MTRKWLLLAAPAAAAALLGAGAVAVTAAPSPSPTPGATDPGQIFVGKLAGILHLSTAQTQNDLKQAELQTVDQMLKDGTITQAQADRMKKRINAGEGVPFVPDARHGAFGDHALMESVRTAELDAAAAKLGLAPADLQSQLRSGKTLAQVEQSKNVPDATVRAAMHDAAKKVLDQAVKDGKITQAQENAALQRIDSGPEPLGPGRGHHGPPPGTS